MIKELFLHVLHSRDETLAAQLAPVLEDAKPGFGDVAIPCFTVRIGAESPAQAADRVAKAVAAAIAASGIRVATAGPYVNCTLPASLIAASLEAPRQMQDTGMTALIEYSSPNIGKPFGIGHLRSTVIGGSLARMYAYSGWRVVTMNHLGDWGTQFGTLLAAFAMWGDEAELAQGDAIKYLYGLYVRFHEAATTDPSLADEGRAWFGRLEGGDREARRLWELFREKSVRSFQMIYDALGISFDHVLGESFYEDKMASALEQLQEKKLLVADDGAQIIEFEKYGIKIPNVIVVKTDGTTTYFLRDVASLLYRNETFGFDKAIYEVGSEQKLHLQQVFAAVKLLGYDVTCEHVDHGLYMFPEGKMSSRKGTLIFIEDVLGQATQKVRGIIDEKNPSLPEKNAVSAAVAVGAIIFQDLRTDRVKTVQFDWDKMLSFEGETGPYLQYTYARMRSILRKAPIAPGVRVTELRSAEELAVAKHVLRFHDALAASVRENKPHILCRYALDLAQLTNAFYVAQRVIGEDEAVMVDRLALLSVVSQTLQTCLSLLLVPVLEEM